MIAGAALLVFPPGSESIVMALSRSTERFDDQIPAFAHFYPEGLGLIAAKVSVMALSARLRVVQKRIEEIEEEDEEAIMQIEMADVVAPSRYKHELSLWRGFGKELRLGVLRELAITSAQRFCEFFSMRYFLSEKMSKSIVKNCSKSAIRKAQRYTGSVYVSKVLYSTFKSQWCFWFALFSVNQAIDTWLTFKVEDKDLLQSGETYTRRLIRNALRCVGGCLLATAGAALGSYMKPGIGTRLGMNIAPQFIFLLV